MLDKLNQLLIESGNVSKKSGLFYIITHKDEGRIFFHDEMKRPEKLLIE